MSNPYDMPRTTFYEAMEEFDRNWVIGRMHERDAELRLRCLLAIKEQGLIGKGSLIEGDNVYGNRFHIVHFGTGEQKFGNGTIEVHRPVDFLLDSESKNPSDVLSEIKNKIEEIDPDDLEKAISEANRDVLRSSERFRRRNQERFKSTLWKEHNWMLKEWAFQNIGCMVDESHAELAVENGRKLRILQQTFEGMPQYGLDIKNEDEAQNLDFQNPKFYLIGNPMVEHSLYSFVGWLGEVCSELNIGIDVKELVGDYRTSHLARSPIRDEGTKLCFLNTIGELGSIQYDGPTRLYLSFSPDIPTKQKEDRVAAFYDKCKNTFGENFWIYDGIQGGSIRLDDPTANPWGAFLRSICRDKRHEEFLASYKTK